MIRITQAIAEPAISQARALFREYATSRGVEPCWDDFELELATLPGQYAPPDGRLLLAMRETSGSPAEIAGCVALRKLEKDACEMKRLFVPPGLRGEGAGRTLVEALIAEARSIGYARMLLDTLPSMRMAHQLYRTIGFREIPAYHKNPIPGALFFELVLR
jgi:carbonic anhydrase